MSEKRTRDTPLSQALDKMGDLMIVIQSHADVEMNEEIKKKDAKIKKLEDKINWYEKLVEGEEVYDCETCKKSFLGEALMCWKCDDCQKCCTCKVCIACKNKNVSDLFCCHNHCRVCIKKCGCIECRDCDHLKKPNDVCVHGHCLFCVIKFGCYKDPRDQ